MADDEQNFRRNIDRQLARRRGRMEEMNLRFRLRTYDLAINYMTECEVLCDFHIRIIRVI